MKYYESHEDAYRRIKKENIASWDEFRKEAESFETFCLKESLAIALNRVKPASDARILEFGCGTGPASCFLAQQGYRVDGFDVSPTAIEIARKNAEDRGLDINYSVGDICSIPEAMFDTYDIIIDGHCMHCITYDSDRRAALTNVFRLLKNGGYFIIETMSIEDTSQWPYGGRIDEQGIVWSRVKKNYPYEKVRFEGKYWICTRRIMSNSDLEDELKQAGFVIEFSEITTEEGNEYMTDYRAICRKVLTN